MFLYILVLYTRMCTETLDISIYIYIYMCILVQSACRGDTHVHICKVYMYVCAYYLWKRVHVQVRSVDVDVIILK